MPRLLGVVLAGGRSSRMGRDKCDLPHPLGDTFLDHAIKRLDEVCDQVVVSGRHCTSSDFKCLPDPVADRGPATGVAVSLQYAHENRFDACLITPVDVPNLTVNELQHLKTAWLDQAITTVATSDRIEPLIGVYVVSDRESIHKLANSPNPSLKQWLTTNHHTSIAFDAKVCRNINHPTDLPEHG